MYNYIYNFTFCIFLNIVWNTNIPTMLQRMYLKNAIHNPGEVVIVFRTFLQNVCVSINKQLSLFQNCFGLLCQLCQGTG